MKDEKDESLGKILGDGASIIGGMAASLFLLFGWFGHWSTNTMIILAVISLSSDIRMRGYSK